MSLVPVACGHPPGPARSDHTLHPTDARHVRVAELPRLEPLQAAAGVQLSAPPCCRPGRAGLECRHAVRSARWRHARRQLACQPPGRRAARHARHSSPRPAAAQRAPHSTYSPCFLCQSWMDSSGYSLYVSSCGPTCNGKGAAGQGGMHMAGCTWQGVPGPGQPSGGGVAQTAGQGERRWAGICILQVDGTHSLTRRLAWLSRGTLTSDNKPPVPARSGLRLKAMASCSYAHPRGVHRCTRRSPLGTPT